jgi:hypothetical protein
MRWHLVYNAGEAWIMDIEKPVKIVLNDAVIVFDNAREAIDVSMAALTKAIESVKTVNDKLYEIAYKDGNLEMEEIK